MADTMKITLVKEFPYRGNPEEWSNSYHYTGPTPDDYGDIVRQLVNHEKTCFVPEVVYKRAYCYHVHDEATRGATDAVIELDDEPSTWSTSGLGYAGMPGDVAATVRWATTDYTSGSRPKRIYLRKYYHGVFTPADPVGEMDSLAPDQKTQFENLADWLAFTDDVVGCGRYCGPHGAVPIGYRVAPYVTTRTLKRRGRRPPP